MHEFLEYRVGDVMTRHPVTITRATPLRQVEALFEAHDFDCLPVSERGALLGIVTKLDVLKVFAFTPRTMIPRYEEVMRQPAETVMMRRPITVTPDVYLTRVLQQMIDTRHHSFPVTSDGVLVGMISRRDVLRALACAAGGRQQRSGPGSRNEKGGRARWMATLSSVK